MNDSPTNPPDLAAEVTRFTDDLAAIERAVRGWIVGQDRAVHLTIVSVVAGGHTLLEGVPGTGKTLLARAISSAISLEFQRVQFTPDLLPADILGCETLAEGSGGAERVVFRPGPIFTQFLLADEINRGTPRTQSALLEGMQEGRVTVAGERRDLDDTFTVVATRNPIEMEGTYPLPEAQLDRFALEVALPAPSVDDLVTIAQNTTGATDGSVASVVSAERLRELRATVRRVVAVDDVVRHAARVVRATDPTSESAPSVVRECVEYGASVRALQSLVLAGKVRALQQGRAHLATEDFAEFVEPVLRHRLTLSLEGEARGVEIAEICDAVSRAADRAS